MLEIRFYILNSQQSAMVHKSPLHMACFLCQKAFESKMRCAIFTASDEQCESLDKLLWQFPQISFLPHAIDDEAGDDDWVNLVTSQGAEMLNESEDDGLVVGLPSDWVAFRPVIVNLSSRVFSLTNLLALLKDEKAEGSSIKLLDIVADEPQAKAKARGRYAYYQKAIKALKDDGKTIAKLEVKQF